MNRRINVNKMVKRQMNKADKSGKLYVVIAAAGEGVRLGAISSKALIPIKGKVMLKWSLEVFAPLENIEKIVIVIPQKSSKESFEKKIGSFESKACIEMIAGESIRQLSVWSGIRALHCEDEDIILVHDAARPFISMDLVNRILDAMERNDCVVPVVPLVDTVKEIRGEYVTGTLNRDSLRCVQTPQAFRYRCYQNAIQRNDLKKETYTDESVLFEKMGYKVKYVAGDRLNIKITYEEDLIIAEAIANSIK